MEKIQQLRATPKKEPSGIQLIRTFIECPVQPLAAQAHCMWDYTDRQHSTRISPDELHEAEIDDSVRAVTNIKKKAFMLKIFGAVHLPPCVVLVINDNPYGLMIALSYICRTCP
jgi:hypothetical protein